LKAERPGDDLAGPFFLMDRRDQSLP